MKVIPLSEAKARLSLYGKLCQEEPIIVTVNGLPAFQLMPIQDDDDLIDQLLKHNPKFRETLESRLRERGVSATEAARRL
ncbi:MAG TPA: type II toxin-antitoxin system prevent-host-death family antitoxin [Gemmataceae bacterium]|nr:type II toxin-antitoxin system prevent-host-death family antitoxin [Gemmataceae bacterium]